MNTDKVEIKPEQITFDLVNEQLNKNYSFRYEFPNKDILFINTEDSSFYKVGGVKYIEVAYGEFIWDSGIQIVSKELFPPISFNKAINVFLERLNSDTPECVSESGSTLEDIRYTSLQVREILNQNMFDGDDVFKKMVLDSLRTRDSFQFIFCNRNKLIISRGAELENYTDTPVECITIEFKDKKKKYCVPRKEYFLRVDLNLALDVFIDKTKLADPGVKSGKSKKSLEEIKIINDERLEFNNYYDYLKVMLIPFWSLVINETPESMGVSDIITVYGDKCYCYKNDWEEVDIPFHKGALLYLLSYANKLCVNRPKVCEWVIDKYPEYLPMIEQAEKQVLKDVYGVIK